MVRLHQILPCPTNCPPQLYNMMVDCWNAVPSSRPSFSTIHRRLHQWVEETTALTTATSVGSDQLLKYNVSPNCPPHSHQVVSSSDQNDFISCYPYNQTATSQAMSGTVLQSAIGLHSALHNNSDGAFRSSVTSSGHHVGPSMNGHNAASDSWPQGSTTPGLTASNYVRYQSDSSVGDANSVNPSSGAPLKMSSRISNNSSLSSTSDCKPPRWPSGKQLWTRVTSHGLHGYSIDCLAGLLTSLCFERKIFINWQKTGLPDDYFGLIFLSG